MKKADVRHYTEEELLLHLLGEQPTTMAGEISSHVEVCQQCSAIRQEFQALKSSVSSWKVPEVPEEIWRARKADLMAHFFRDRASLKRRESLSAVVLRWCRFMWGYAVENPLPTMGYIAVAVAFASERTISLFRLDKILPATNEVLEILRQIL
jgi:hypothetical protein